MPLDDSTREEINKLVAELIKPTLHIMSHRVDQSMQTAAKAEGIAEASQKASERDKEGIVRELHNGLGRLDVAIENLRAEINRALVIVATNEHSIKGMRASLYGDERPNAPSIQSDINRLQFKLQAVKVDMEVLTDLSERVANVEKGSETIYRDLKTLLLIQRVLNASGDKLLKPVWQLFDRYRWVKIVVGVGSPAIAILIEFLKAIGVL